MDRNYRQSYSPDTGEIVEFTDTTSVVVGYAHSQEDADAQISDWHKQWDAEGGSDA